MNSSSNAARFPLWQALAASLALHALLAAQTLTPPRRTSLDQPLAATLRESAPRRLETRKLEPDSAAAGAERKQVQARSSALARRTPAALPVAAQAAVEAAAPAVDAEGLSSYRFGLARAARGLLRYPEAALVAGLGGRLTVRLEVAASGAAAPPRLVASSGSELLDAAALDLVARAASATAVPERLRGAAFSVVLPLEFDPESR